MPIVYKHEGPLSTIAQHLGAYRGGQATKESENARLELQDTMQRRSIQAQQTGQMFNGMMGIAQQQIGIQARKDMQNTAYMNAFSMMGQREQSAIRMDHYSKFNEMPEQTLAGYDQFSQTPQGLGVDYPSYLQQKSVQMAGQQYEVSQARAGNEQMIPPENAPLIQAEQNQLSALDSALSSGIITQEAYNQTRPQHQENLQRLKQKQWRSRTSPLTPAELWQKQSYTPPGASEAHGIFDSKGNYKQFTKDQGSAPTIYQQIMKLPPGQRQAALAEFYEANVYERDGVPYQINEKGRLEVVDGWKPSKDGWDPGEEYEKSKASLMKLPEYMSGKKILTSEVIEADMRRKQDVLRKFQPSTQTPAQASPEKIKQIEDIAKGTGPKAEAARKWLRERGR